jgi:hypothetical protein
MWNLEANFGARLAQMKVNAQSLPLIEDLKESENEPCEYCSNPSGCWHDHVVDQHIRSDVGQYSKSAQRRRFYCRPVLATTCVWIDGQYSGRSHAALVMNRQ